jgi:hypothetical protein
MAHVASHRFDVVKVQHVDVDDRRRVADLDGHRARCEGEHVGDQGEQLVGAHWERHRHHSDVDRRAGRQDLAGQHGVRLDHSDDHRTDEAGSGKWPHDGSRRWPPRATEQPQHERDHHDPTEHITQRRRAPQEQPDGQQH